MSDETDTPPAAPAPAASGGKMIPLMVGMNTLLVGGLIALQLLRPSAAAPAAPGKDAHGETAKKAHGEGQKDEPSGEDSPTSSLGPTLKMAEFMVHLRNADVDRYARMSFEIEVLSEKEKTELTAQTPRLRDAFIGYLSDRTVEELRGSEGLDRTKQALLARVSQVVPNVKARSLYITDLVIQ